MLEFNEWEIIYSLKGNLDFVITKVEQGPVGRRGKSSRASHFHDSAVSSSIVLEKSLIA